MLLYLSCHVSPLIMLPPCEQRIHEALRANMCFTCRARSFVEIPLWVASIPLNSDIQHATPPPLLCCLTLCDLWLMSTWTFKIRHFPHKLSAGGPIYTSFLHGFPCSPWRNTWDLWISKQEMFAGLHHFTNCEYDRIICHLMIAFIQTAAYEHIVCHVVIVLILTAV